MTAVTWTATTRLATGSSVGDANSLDFLGAEVIDPNMEGTIFRHVTEARERVHVIKSLYDQWQVSAQIPDSDRELALEFIASTVGAQPFTFDPYGTIAVPDNAITVVLVSQNMVRQRRRWQQSTADWSLIFTVEDTALIT